METIFDKPLDKQVTDNTQAIANLTTKVEGTDLYSNELLVGKYNGSNLYKRILTSPVTSFANNTPVAIPFTVTPPQRSKTIVAIFTIFNTTTNTIEFPDAYHRIYMANDVWYLSQTVGSGSQSIIVRAEIYYVH